jgi:hypothetical protein
VKNVGRSKRAPYSQLLSISGGGAIRFSNTGKVSKKSKVAGGEGDIITNTIHV